MLDYLNGELEGDVPLDFYLSYRGPLKATQRDPKDGTIVKTAHWNLKHEIRLAFHVQLRKIWESHKLLKSKSSEQGSMLNVTDLARDFTIGPWSFVPLVTDKLEVLCGLKMTLLRLDHPGSSLWSGDIDNRVKTLIDALEVPDANSGYSTDIPLDPTVGPLYCLLANDKLLTSLSVETGQLLSAPHNVEQSWAELSIHVHIKPENVTMLNIGL